jgi:pentatricopeptide repeat domain-containing protein 1
MHGRGQPPDILTYNSILDALCKNLNVDKAIALLTKIKGKDIQPSMHTHNILINGLCIGGRLEDARKVSEDLLVKGYNLNVHTYRL